MSNSLSKKVKINMISYSVLFINKTFCRAKAFSQILTDLPKCKLAIIKSNNLKICNNFDNLELIFWKRIFLAQNSKTEHYHSIPHVWIRVGTKFTLNKHFWVFGLSLPRKGVSRVKQKKWTSSLNSAYSNWSRYQISASMKNFNFLDQHGWLH